MTTSTDTIKASRISNIEVNDIFVDKTKTNMRVPIHYKGENLVFQTPFLEIIGGFKKTRFPNIYQFDTLFKGDSKTKIKNWFQFVEDVEVRIIDQISEVGAEWFSKGNINITSLIREIDPAKSTLFMKWPVKLKSDMFVDVDGNTIDPTNLKDKDRVKLIVEISHLWINDNNNCGLVVIVEKVLVKPYVAKSSREYLFNDTDSDSDIDDNESNIISLLATEQKARTKAKVPKSKSLQANINNLHTRTNIVTTVAKKVKIEDPFECSKQSKISFNEPVNTHDFSSDEDDTKINAQSAVGFVDDFEFNGGVFGQEDTDSEIEISC